MSFGNLMFVVLDVIKNKLVIIIVEINVVNAAPFIPYRGIKIKFNRTFVMDVTKKIIAVGARRFIAARIY
ncbi:MAG: hypothetical protein CVT89_08440 [Candidatus Altiarchaeales archaeon HGW-Altiarchaeales-2]|nr:MAG: hypothetical protein CVT89_08440 [Candidatus Altiarchaeales archaeon HGW-Altiarchaeales-2]